MPPIAIVAGIAAAGSLAGGAIAAHGAGSAANTQANAADYAAQLQANQAQQALDFQKQQFATQQQEIAPFLQTGYSGLANLGYLLGLTPGPSSGAPAPVPVDQTRAGLQAPTMTAPGDIPTPPGYGTSGMSYPLNYGPPTAIPSGTTPTSASNPNGINVPQNLSSLVNPNIGSFGQLTQPFSEQFQAPTALTEQNDPGFQSRLKLGQQILENSAAAKGNVLTGGTAKDLNQFAQDYASNEYNNTYNRAMQEFQNRFNIYQTNQGNLYNRLASMAGLGQTATNQLVNSGNNASGNVSNILLTSGQQIGNQINNAGAARASGYAAGGNIWGNALSNTAGNVGNMFLLSKLLGNGGGGWTPPSDPFGMGQG